MSTGPGAQQRIRSAVRACCWLLMVVSGSYAIRPAAGDPAGTQPLVTPRIVGGTAAGAGDWPYLVNLVWAGGDPFYQRFCAGTLVHREWVMTAAHCVDGAVASQIQVYTGLHNLLLDTPAEVIGAAELITHPGYNRDTLDFDVALIRLGSPSSRPPAVLYGGNSALDGSNSTVIGWGVLSYQGAASATLQQVDLPIIGNALCASSYPGSITERMLCAGFADGGKASCTGDSGGPLLVWLQQRYVQAGIVSWGYECALPDYYDVYTRISAVRVFLEQQVPGIVFLPTAINIAPILQLLLLGK